LFSECLEKKPKIVESYINRASANLGFKKYDAAIKDLQVAVRIEPNYPQIYILYAVIYIQLKNYDLAYEYIEKGIKSGPYKKESAILLSLRGTIFLNKKNYKDAVEDFLECINFYPAIGVSYYNSIGYSLIYLKKFNESIEYLNKAIKQNPQDAFYYNNRGFAYSNLGEYDRAFFRL
jgi:tetratricopeptide (TPR) repeat protein